MQPKLKEYFDRDEGINQFCSRYGYATLDDHVREQYHRWNMERMRELGQLSGARTEGKLEGIEIGKAQGKLEGKNDALREVALKLLKLPTPLEDISEATGFSERELEKLAQVNNIDLGQSSGGLTMSM